MSLTNYHNTNNSQLPQHGQLQGPKGLAVGLSRTSTMLLAEAFNKLGFAPTYHMVELFFSNSGGEQSKAWLDAYHGKPVDFQSMLQGFNSILDIQYIDFFQEITKVLPGAKVILQTEYEVMRSVSD